MEAGSYKAHVGTWCGKKYRLEAGGCWSKPGHAASSAQISPRHNRLRESLAKEDAKGKRFLARVGQNSSDLCSHHMLIAIGHKTAALEAGYTTLQASQYFGGPGSMRSSCLREPPEA